MVREDVVEGSGRSGCWTMSTVEFTYAILRMLLILLWRPLLSHWVEFLSELPSLLLSIWLAEIQEALVLRRRYPATGCADRRQGLRCCREACLTVARPIIRGVVRKLGEFKD